MEHFDWLKIIFRENMKLIPNIPYSPLPSRWVLSYALCVYNLRARRIKTGRKTREKSTKKHMYIVKTRECLFLYLERFTSETTQSKIQLNFLTIWDNKPLWLMRNI